jgi:hypothetical protein
MNKPVALLAFANDRQNAQRYLRNLSDELVYVQAALEGAGLEVRLLPAVTLPRLVAEFQQYQDRIVIFHYGGHADGDQLLLEGLGGTSQVVHAGGLLPFLATYRHSLKLVFINACLTQALAAELKAAGIAAAIGTHAPISDDLATKLAQGFYQGLARRVPLATAWGQAVSQLAMTRPGLAVAERGMYRELPQGADYFSWDIWYADPSNQNWVLPQPPSAGPKNMTAVTGRDNIVIQGVSNSNIQLGGGPVPPAGGLAGFKQQLRDSLDEEGFAGVPEVLDQIAPSGYQYDKPTLALLRQQALAPLTALNPGPYLAQLKVFIGGLRE